MFRLSAQPIDAAALRAGLERPDAGALVVFEGRVRDKNQGRAVDRLDYDVAGELALAEGEKVLAEARDKFSLLDVLAVHRTGSLACGDVAVWVGVLAVHRDVAFEACRYVIDQINARVPIWKKEHYAGGQAEWLNAGPAS